MPHDVTQWAISVSTETDRVVREFLRQGGEANSDLSSFIEDAARWRVLDRTVAQARAGFSDLRPDEIETLIDQAVEASRLD